MINFNGTIQPDDFKGIDYHNRAFKYGDALFETIKIQEESVLFCEDHYFRLMASMRMLRMEIPLTFTYEFFESEILKTVNANTGRENRVRFTVFRNANGLYTPSSHQISFLIEVKEVSIDIKQNYIIDLYKDFSVAPHLLSGLKTNNKMINVLASIYAKENQFDNCVLLNTDKNVVEFTNGNIFLIKGNIVTTPPLSDGCVKGVMRKQIIDALEAHSDFVLSQKSISPFAIQKADEVFLTNVIVGVQPVTRYRKKQYGIEKTLQIQNLI